MSASTHIAVWPKVRVTVEGKSKVVERGEAIPAGVSSVDLDNLTSFGAIAGVTGVPDQGDSKSDKVEDILAEVGDDKEKAQVALETEQAKAKPRKTLVEPLEALLAKNDS